MEHYYVGSAGQVLSRLNSSPIGISGHEAGLRLQRFGTNSFGRDGRTGFLRLFIGQFKDVMTLLLIAAAAVTAVIAFISGDRADLTDTFIILFIILLNAVVGTVQQYRADRAIENLKKLSACIVKCRRDGELPCGRKTGGKPVCGRAVASRCYNFKDRCRLCGSVCLS